MAIRLVIDITPVQLADGTNAAGVDVRTEPFVPEHESDSVGTMWCGICLAINAYMRSKGCADFDCLQPRKEH